MSSRNSSSTARRVNRACVALSRRGPPRAATAHRRTTLVLIAQACGPDTARRANGLARRPTDELQCRLPSQSNQPSFEPGAGGNRCSPGPSTNVSGERAGCCPTPGRFQSHTPSGNVSHTACSAARR
jgi:hypothetical protein